MNDVFKKALVEKNTDLVQELLESTDKKEFRPLLASVHDWVCDIFTKVKVQDLSRLENINLLLDAAKSDMGKKTSKDTFVGNVMGIINAVWGWECELYDRPPFSQHNNNQNISYMEALAENYEHKKHDELMFLITEGKVSKDLFTILNILYWHLRHQKTNDVLNILLWLLSHKNVIVGDLTDFEEIENVVKNKNDIIWILWKLALLFSKHRLAKNKIVYEFVLFNLQLYTFMYQKQLQKKKPRLNVLIYVFFTLSCTNVTSFFTKDVPPPLQTKHKTSKQKGSKRPPRQDYSYLTHLIPRS